MIDAFGWTWEYIDDSMTLPRLEAVAKHWRLVPPAAVSLAAIAGALGVKRAEPAKRMGLNDASELAGLLGMGGAGFNKEVPEWVRAAANG